MTTNFALSLSIEGIEMLHRVQRGWKRVGTADVEAEDLDAQLAELRRKAEAIAPDGLRTKLIIPLDQIKYTAIDSTQTTQDDIYAVLDGSTPYALDDLVIDCERFGGRTHIAAVARETLAEAEVFAHAHGFRPVCFAAIPEPFTFQKEVFFGPTSMMPDILGPDGSVQGDALPVMVVGTRIESRLLVLDLPEDALPPTQGFDLAAALAPHVAEDLPPAEVTPPSAPQVAPAAVAKVAPPPVQDPAVVVSPPETTPVVIVETAPVEIPQAAVAAPEYITSEPVGVIVLGATPPEVADTHFEAPDSVAPEAAQAPEPVAPESADAPTQDITQPPVIAETDPAETDPVVDTPVAAAETAPVAPEAALTPEPVAPDSADAPTQETTQPPVVAETDPAETDPIVDTPIAVAETAPFAPPEDAFDENADAPASLPEAAAPEPDLLAVLDTADVTPPRPTQCDNIIPEYHAPALEQDLEIASVVAEDPVLFVPPLLDIVIPEVRKKPQKPVKKRRSLSTSAPQLAPAQPQLGAAQARAPRAAPPANTPRKPALIAGAVAASLVVVMGAVSWTVWPSTSDVADTSDTPAETIPLAEIAPDVTAVPTLPPPASVDVIAVGPVVPQIEITGFSVAPDDAVSTPDLPIPAEPAAPVLRSPEAVAVAALPDALPVPVQPAPPLAPTPEVAPEVPVAQEGAPILRGTVLSPADAQSIYSATGVWQRAPRFVDLPTETSTDGLIIPFSESMPARVEQPQAPLVGDLDTDLSFLAPADPPAAEVRFPVDANGFILATPQGTLTPEGAVVFAGAPPDLNMRLRPELTPADLDRMALLAPAPDGVQIIEGRPANVPPLRPVGAALPDPVEPVAPESAEAADPTPGAVPLDGLTDLAVDDPDVRPTPRPETVPPAEDPGTPDITAIIAGIDPQDPAAPVDPEAIVNATPQAVVASLRPALRPQNFDSIVAAARALAATQPAPTVRTAAPVAPQNYAPVPGGVARAATQDDVLPLRQINLIGVYGRPNERRALVRLSNGRYVRVEVGSTLDGGQVTAINETALNYVKRGRTLALQLPSG